MTVNYKLLYVFSFKKHTKFCANKTNSTTSLSFCCVPKMLILRQASSKQPSTQTQILQNSNSHMCKVCNSLIATKSHKNLSSKFQVFSYKCDKPISYVAVADMNQQCVVEKENRKYL